MAERVTISNLRYGYDTRRSVLTSVPGTLVTCQNAHINQGGEAEKRKAFVLFADVGIMDNDTTPANALLDENNNPVLDEGGNYILVE